MAKRYTSKKIEQLRAEIAELRKLYYNGTPATTDAEFDRLFGELQSLEASQPDLFSPTEEVGVAPVASARKHHHLVPMLSLDNVYSDDELRAFDERLRKLAFLDVSESLPYVVELKIDGASLSVTYQDGIMTTAATRGDGLVGEVVTTAARNVRGLPHEIPVSGIFELRGEVVLPRSEFEELNELRESEGEDAFANPRNTVAGLLRAKAVQTQDLRRLQFYGYQLVASDLAESPVNTSDQDSVLALLKQWSVAVAPNSKTLSDIERVIEFCSEVTRNRPQVGFDLDGVVVKAGRPDVQDRAGMTNRTPRWAIAFKFPTQAVTTMLEGIEFDVGRTGRVTPRAVLTPVEIGGTTVSSATLNSVGEINRLKLRVGDNVVIEKGGEIIPKVVRAVANVARRKNLFKMPQLCPKCSSRLVNEDGAHYFCPNASCPARLRAALVHFASRKAMNIEGLGEGLIDRLVTAGKIADVADIYYLGPRDLASLWKDGEVISTKLIAQIEASKSSDLSRLIFGLGIRHVGQTASKRLANRLRELMTIAETPESVLREIPDIGPTVAKSVSDFFKDPTNREVVSRLEQAGVNTAAQGSAPRRDGPFAGMSIVLTGGLSKSREHFERLIEDAGGSASSSVSKKTAFVVAGEGAGSKRDKALKLGIEVIDEAEFLARIMRSQA